MQLGYLDAVCQLHPRVKSLHESLEALQPIAVVHDGNFFLFVPNQGKYEFIMTHPTPFPITFDIQAAFPLDFYDNKFAAILTEKTLANPDAYDVIFHEFVHCYQGNTFEFAIKNELKINKTQTEAGNYSWEISYSFPYADNVFCAATEQLDDFPTYIKTMKAHLQIADYEYLIWQAWKEGFARYVQNLVRTTLGQPPIEEALIQPFDRISLYELGNRYIDTLVKSNATHLRDLHKLFRTMYGNDTD